MNLCSNKTLTQIRNSQKLHLMWWVPAQSENSFSYEDWIGDPEEAYAADGASALPAFAPLPDIEPDEFESDYCWFLS